MEKILIKEDSIETAVAVHSTISEFKKAWTKEDFERRYRNSPKLILVAYINDQPAGYLVAYQKTQDTFYCSMIGVNPLFRRRGVLKKMMSYVDNWALAHNYQKITLKTRNSHREMLTYLINVGFDFTKVKSHSPTSGSVLFLEKSLI